MFPEGKRLDLAGLGRLDGRQGLIRQRGVSLQRLPETTFKGSSSSVRLIE
jgi:hypothetical protein